MDSKHPHMDDYLFEKVRGEQMCSDTRGAPSLNLDELFKAKKLMDRYSKVYFLECRHLSDDCYGIMYNRKEDMPERNTTTKNYHRETPP